MVVSEDDGFSWTPPKWTNIWGYPPELIALQDGRYLMIYGYRRPPYGMRGMRLGGRRHLGREERVRHPRGRRARRTSEAERPGSARMSAGSGKYGSGAHRLEPSRRLPAHRLSERGADAGRHDRRLLSRMERGRAAAAICALHPLPARRLSRSARRPSAAEHRVVLRDEHAYLRPSASDPQRRTSCCWSATGRRGGRSSCIRREDPLYLQPAAALGGRGPDAGARPSWCRPMAGTASNAPA